MKDLMEMFNYGMEVVEACGIETGIITDVSINTRAKKRFGQCRYNHATGTYSINIARFILDDDIEDKAVMETIIHEILHTVSGCMNHGKKWKSLGKIVEREFGYKITTTDSYAKFSNRLAEERKVERNTKKHNYVFRCEDCGQTIYRERMSKFVQYYKHYRCGKCGGDFQFMANESNMQILTATGKLTMVANTGR
jgi:predicted SprT family Zn-dependent metalloprotease